VDYFTIKIQQYNNRHLVKLLIKLWTI